MAGETPIPWSDYLGLGAYAVDLSQQLLGVPSPLDLFIGSFSGRPTLDATAAIAGVYNSYTSPVTKLLALGAADLLKQGIAISSPAAGPIFGPYYKAALVLENEIRWQSQAPNIVALDNATLGNALNEAGNPGSGTATLQAIDAAYHTYIARGSWPGMAAIATNPPDGTGTAGQLEQGVAKEFIAHNPTTTPGTGPSTGGPPLPPNPGPADPEGDELIDSANAIEQYLYYIAYWLRPTGTISAQPDPCCEQIVASLNLIQTGLNQIASATASLKTPPIDLSAVTAEIDCICKALLQINLTEQGATVDITAAIQGVANAIKENGNAKAIADAINHYINLADKPESAFKFMFDSKVIPPEASGMLQGTLPHWVHVALAWAAAVSPPIAFAEELLGDDADAQAGRRKLRYAINTIAGKWMQLNKDLGKVAKTDGPNPMSLVLKSLLSTQDTLFVPAIEPFITTIKSLLTGNATSGTVINQIGVNADNVIAAVLGISLTAMAGAWLASFGGWDVSESVTKIAETIGAAVGYEELKDVTVGPLVRHGIARIAEQDAKKTFRQELIGASSAYSLASRGIISRVVADYLAALNGLPKELEQPIAESSFHGMSPRIMLRLIEAHLFTPAEIQDELTFSGMRPVSQARLLRAADFIGTNTYRNQLNATIEQAYEAGLLDDGEVCSMVDSNDQNTDRCQLILERLHLKVRMDSAKALESEYATLYQGGLIDATTYQANLSGLGLQNWKTQNLLAVNEAKVAARLSREEAAAARALARATAAVERKAAIRNYLQGNIDEIALAAALALTGLTPVQALAWTDLAKLQKDGSLRWVYGLHLPQEQAGLLSDRVKALAAQYEKLEIDQPTFVAALQTAKIPATYINAILADASTKEGTKVKGSYIPVQLT